MNAIELNHIWKKFQIGEENYDSLRDKIPAIAKKILRAQGKNEKKDFWALKDISFAIRPGEAVGIIGPNGSGKSTILKILCNILTPNRGNLIVNGRLSALIEIGAGFHPDLTGRENIYLNGAILGMKVPEIRKKIDEIVSFSGIEEFIDTPVKRYSSGMYARLGFSIAAHVNPEILLVDEVLSVGDWAFQTKCIEKMNKFVKDGVTVIFISHNLPSILQLCPRTILLQKGEIRKDGKSSDVCRYYYKSYAEVHSKTSSIQLKSALLTDLEDGQKNVFKMGNWAKLKLELHSKDDLENFIMGFMIRKTDGQNVFDVHSNDICGNFFSIKGGEPRVFEILFRTNLASNTYLCGMHIFKENVGFLYYNEELLQFYVDSPKSLGDAFLDVKWVV